MGAFDGLLRRTLAVKPVIASAVSGLVLWHKFASRGFERFDWA